MAATRPVVSVFDAQTGNNVGSVAQPAVFTAPIRSDIVQFVHTNMRKNNRQAYAVAFEAGHQTSAISWGTGRAVSRIPRVNGGGTHRAGQGAFGNMCRSGRMFGPTRQWRRWNRHVNQNQRRYATVSALAASAIPTLVMARGHAVNDVKEFPLVVDNLSSITKTKEAVAVLKALGADADLQRVKDSKKLRAGKGKMRNRRYTQKVGPLVVYGEDNGLTRAFRNLPGVTLCSVNSLNLLQLAPGGHVGRFVIWTKDAFERLDALYGSYTEGSTEKKGYTLPRHIMTTADVSRIINSTEVQSVVRPIIKQARTTARKKNPLKNWQAMTKLNPYAIVQRRNVLKGLKVGAKRAQPSAEQRKAARAASKAFYQTMITDDYVTPADVMGAGAGAGAGAA